MPWIRADSVRLSPVCRRPINRFGGAIATAAPPARHRCQSSGPLRLPCTLSRARTCSWHPSIVETTSGLVTAKILRRQKNRRSTQSFWQLGIYPYSSESFDTTRKTFTDLHDFQHGALTEEEGN